MPTRVLTFVRTLGVASAVAVSPAWGRARTPVLGSHQAFSNGQGGGTVKPRVVFLGGDPTGRVTGISWTDWGAARAVGDGRGWCPGQSVAAGHYCSAALYVSRLGTCHGHWAYRSLAFYFKDRGKWVFGSKWNACSGP
jgi:hypothetical protein